jgi:hypothetical protein
MPTTHLDGTGKGCGVTLRWPEDAATIIEWASGATVDADALVNELEEWGHHFASADGAGVAKYAYRGAP